jgi:hypothetical protein
VPVTPVPSGGDPATFAAALVRSLGRTTATSVIAIASPGARQLSDAVVAASLGLPVLYAGPAAVPAATVAFLQHQPGITRLRIFGGNGSVTAAVVARLRQA